MVVDYPAAARRYADDPGPGGRRNRRPEDRGALSERTDHRRDADPSSVGVTKANRLVGHKAGRTQIKVSQGKLQAAVDVTVEPAEVLSIAFDPAKVVVPVDDAVCPRVVATIRTKDGEREAEMAPSRLTCEKRPSPQFALLKPETLELVGITPTNAKAPQTLALRLDKQRASAPVEVIVPSLKLTLEPAGPIDLPVGQMRGLQAVAEYKDGRKVNVPSHLVKWHAESTAKAAPGLELREDKLVALKPDAGPLPVYATYYGNESNRVVFKSVAGESISLQLKAEKKDHQPGETGTIRLVGTTPNGEVELAPDLATFRSSDDKVVTIGEKSGAYRAITPGEATVTAAYPAAKEPASLKMAVIKPKEPHGDQPLAVRIVSDQGTSVRFPVGAEFDDFRVVAEYADGFTRVVTKKATITTPEPPQDAPLAARNGRLVGVRPGKTQVQAAFDGIAAKDPLAAEVTADVDIDRIQLAPAPMSMLRGETIAMSAVGYKNDKSVGVITGLGNLAWQSSNPQVAKVEGPAVTGVGLGQSDVTVQLGSVTSLPAAVSVVESIADALTVEPKVIRIRVGEGVRIGADLMVLRGDMDLSAQCSVTPAVPNVVRYAPETRTLVGVAPGTSPVAVTVGDKLANVMVDVVPAGGPIDGQVVVEPAAGVLAPGQALPLSVFVVTPEGHRIDRTASAVFGSSDSSKIRMMGDRACAMAPGAAQITASLPGAKTAGTASLTVNNEEIASLVVEPSRLNMAVGDTVRMRILGAAASGTHELFPQPDLKLTPGGASPEVISIAGAADVYAVKPGQASLAVRWRDKLNQDVPVNIVDNIVSDLRIDPLQAAIHPGQGIVYQVSGMVAGQRRVLGPENGVELFTGQQEVAQPAGQMVVRGNNLGRTTVVAKLGGQSAEAILDVTGTGAVGTEVVRGGMGTEIVGGLGGVDRVTTVYDPDDPAWAAIMGGNETIVERGGPGAIGVAPAAAVVDLRFVPDVLRMAKDSPPTGVRVVEVLADGRDGRDVTADPSLEITDPPQVATIEKTAAGPLFRPIGEGQTRVAAKMGDIVTRSPLLIAVGESSNATVQVAASDPLSIEPSKISLQVGEATPPLAVMAHRADGGPPYEVPAALESMDPNVLTPDPQNPGRFVAKAFGGTQVRALYRGREAVATVEVTGKRFVSVTPTLNEGDQDFNVSVKVVAAESEGELEYRVYAAGQPPAESWVPAQQAGESRQVELRSPRMAYGPRGTRYQLMIEARSPSGGSVQQYPLTFQLKARIEETK